MTTVLCICAAGGRSGGGRLKISFCEILGRVSFSTFVPINGHRDRIMMSSAHTTGSERILQRTSFDAGRRASEENSLGTYAGELVLKSQMERTEMRVAFDLPRDEKGAALICFSHLRWNFVYQRPQHLLSRAAKRTQVFYFEEPVFGSQRTAFLQITKTPSGVTVVVPHLPRGGRANEHEKLQRDLLNDFIERQKFSELTFWYYTPMALAFSDHIAARLLRLRLHGRTDRRFVSHLKK